MQIQSVDGNIKWGKCDLLVEPNPLYLHKQGGIYRTNEGVDVYFLREFRSDGHDREFNNMYTQGLPVTLNLFQPDWDFVALERLFTQTFTMDRWDLKVAISQCLDFHYDGDIAKVAKISADQLQRYMKGGQLYLPQGVDIPAIADVWAGVLAEPVNLWTNYRIPARQYWQYWLSFYAH